MFGMNGMQGLGQISQDAYYEQMLRQQAMSRMQGFGQAGIPPGHCGSGGMPSIEPLLLLLETEDNQGE